jgi:hypothetical protein
LATLTAGVVTVELSSLPAGAFVIDERIAVQGPPIKNSYGPLADKLKLGIRSGSHRFTAHIDGYQDQVWMVDGQPGGALQHQFELKLVPAAAGPETSPGTPPPAGGATVVVKERPVPTGVYIGLAATGVLAVGTGVVGGLALSKHGDFQSKNDGSDPSGAQSLKDSGKTLNLATDILLGGAVVAGAVTAVLYFSRPSVTIDHGFFQVVPVAGPRMGGLSLAGSF